MSLQAPGLTCAACGGDLYPDEARRTDDGWRHSNARGICLSNRMIRDNAIKRAQRIEDLEWMADTGECFSGAAKRIGVTPVALDRWFRTNDGLNDLWRRLLAREPAGSWHERRKKAAA